MHIKREKQAYLSAQIRLFGRDLAYKKRETGLSICRNRGGGYAYKKGETGLSICQMQVVLRNLGIYRQEIRIVYMLHTHFSFFCQTYC